MKKYTLIKKYICGLIFFAINLSIFSHPHMYLTSSIEFVFFKTELQGAYVTWTFDRFFSAEVISGYDTDMNGIFNSLETDDVYENAFSYCENYYYFIFIRQGNIRTSPKYIDKKKFSVHQKNGIISYRFFVDLTSFKGKDLFFACYDYTFFCDITYIKNNPVKFRYNSNKINPSYSIVENKNYPVYYNPIGAIDDNRIYYKWAPGLNTYYPKEIHIKF